MAQSEVSDLEPLDLDLASPFTRSVLGVIELIVLSLISSGKDGKDRCRASRVTPGRPARVSCYFRASGQLVNKLSYWEELPWKLCLGRVNRVSENSCTCSAAVGSDRQWDFNWFLS